MNHLRARGLLAALPDGTLAPALEAELRRHVSGCARCQRQLDQYAAIDALLRALPRQLIPPEPSAETDQALGLVARWLGPVRKPWFVRLPIQPLGAVITAAALLLGVFLLTPPFEIESAEPFNVVVLASAPPPHLESPRRVVRTTQTVVPARFSDSYLIPVAVR